jgi:hypothetical protein
MSEYRAYLRTASIGEERDKFLDNNKDISFSRIAREAIDREAAKKGIRFKD